MSLPAVSDTPALRDRQVRLWLARERRRQRRERAWIILGGVLMVGTSAALTGAALGWLR